MQKLGQEWNYNNLTRAIHRKSEANITLNTETLKVFPLISGTEQECLLI